MIRLHTFGLRYSWGVEEVDVHADTHADAVAAATALANAEYDPGWTLVDLPPGGSGGLVMYA